MLLRGKTPVVTGGNSGIGAAIVRAATAEGANVVVDYVVGPEETDQIVAAIELHKMVRTAVDTYGRLDVLVNNAGVETRTRILETSEEDYDRVMAVNLKSAFFGAQFAAKQFLAQGDGGIVINSSSVHGDWPMPAMSPIACPRTACAC